MYEKRVRKNIYLCRQITETMEYLNEFHRISTERKLKEMADWEKQPVDIEAEVRRHAKMHEELARLYPEKKRNE